MISVKDKLLLEVAVGAPVAIVAVGVAVRFAVGVAIAVVEVPV